MMCAISNQMETGHTIRGNYVGYTISKGLLFNQDNWSLRRIHWVYTILSIGHYSGWNHALWIWSRNCSNSIILIMQKAKVGDFHFFFFSLLSHKRLVNLSWHFCFLLIACTKPHSGSFLANALRSESHCNKTLMTTSVSANMIEELLAHGGLFCFFTQTRVEQFIQSWQNWK